MSSNPNASLDDAIAAARAGRRDDALRMLRQIVANDPFNANAWVWLGGVTTDPREQRSALEQALTVDPNHQRAQQGLAWLRQNRPDVFDGPAPSETRPIGNRHTPSYEQTATSGAKVYEAEPYRATPYNAPTQAPPVASAADAPTQAMPVASTADAPTQAMPVASTATVAPVSTTDRMPTVTKPAQVYNPGTEQLRVPPPAAAPATESDRPQYARAGGANFARWILILLWGFGFGAVATVAAITFVNPAQFTVVANQLVAALFGWQIDQPNAAQLALITAAILTGIAIFDLIIFFGLIARGRWAWVLNLIVALITFVGAVAIVLFTFIPVTGSFLGLPAPQLIGQPTFANPAFVFRMVLFGITLLYLIVSFASRRAFFRRRLVQQQIG